MYITLGLNQGTTRGIFAISLLIASPSAFSEDWAVRKQTMGNICHVQKTSASPLGETLSEHPSHVAACKEAQRLYDPDVSDLSKCWRYGEGTRSSCKAEGVVLNKIVQKKTK